MKEPFSSYSKIFTSHNQEISPFPCVFRYLRSNRKKNGKNRGFMNQIGVRSLFRNIHR